MPSGYKDNHGDCKARYTTGLSICDRGTKERIGTVSFGCSCNGMFLQKANYGVVTYMKDQSPKMQAKCARLFSQWSAEQVEKSIGDSGYAYQLAPSVALKCNPTRKLAMKAKHQDAFLHTVSQLTP